MLHNLAGSFSNAGYPEVKASAALAADSGEWNSTNANPLFLEWSFNLGSET